MKKTISVPTLFYSTLAVLILIALLTVDASACPACKEAIGEQGSGLGAGLSYTVIGMASMPFLLFGMVASIVVRAFIKHRRAQDEGIGFDQSDLN